MVHQRTKSLLVPNALKPPSPLHLNFARHKRQLRWGRPKETLEMKKLPFLLCLIPLLAGCYSDSEELRYGTDECLTENVT